MAIDSSDSDIPATRVVNLGPCGCCGGGPCTSLCTKCTAYKGLTPYFFVFRFNVAGMFPTCNCWPADFWFPDNIANPLPPPASPLAWFAPHSPTLTHSYEFNDCCRCTGKIPVMDGAILDGFDGYVLEENCDEMLLDYAVPNGGAQIVNGAFRYKCYDPASITEEELAELIAGGYFPSNGIAFNVIFSFFNINPFPGCGETVTANITATGVVECEPAADDFMTYNVGVGFPIDSWARQTFTFDNGQGILYYQKTPDRTYTLIFDGTTIVESGGPGSGLYTVDTFAILDPAPPVGQDTNVFLCTIEVDWGVGAGWTDVLEYQYLAEGEYTVKLRGTGPCVSTAEVSGTIPVTLA